jgi:hypothetical protein
MGQKFFSTTLRLGHGRLHNIGAVLCLAAAGCATLPQNFIPIDERASFDKAQLSADQAICQDEIKRNLSIDNQTTIWGPTEDAITIYNGCMAAHGYKPGSLAPPPQWQPSFK